VNELLEICGLTVELPTAATDLLAAVPEIPVG